MAWVTPTTRATGYLVTAATWNQDVVDNPAYLKGRAGTVVIEDSIRSDTDKLDNLGSDSIRYYAIYGLHLYGNRYRASPSVREIRFTWERGETGLELDDGVGTADSRPRPQLAVRTNSGGSARAAGTGQIRLKTDLDVGGSTAAIENLAASNGARANSFTVSKKPYLRLEFALEVNDSRQRVFIGFRETLADAVPADVDNKKYCGLRFNGTNWQQVHSAGAGTETATNLTVTAAARHVVEVWIESATAVELWLDGALILRSTATLPTGSLDWQVLADVPTGTGALDDGILTLGELIMQEEF